MPEIPSTVDNGVGDLLNHVYGDSEAVGLVRISNAIKQSRESNYSIDNLTNDYCVQEEWKSGANYFN